MVWGEEEEEEKSRVLVVGGTGFIGRRMVMASLKNGNPTYVLRRPEIGLNTDKLEILQGFKSAGAIIVEASFSDHHSLLSAVRLVDVVISTVSGDTSSAHTLLLQLKLVDAIKEAGNIKRFLPSEFGMDPSRMMEAIQPGRVIFEEKMKVREAVEAANIPFTYISSNCFGMYFVGNLCQLRTLLPPKETVSIYGDGQTEVVFMDEDDVGTYTIKSMDDPRTLNRTIYIRPKDNILTQLQLVHKWENMAGVVLNKLHITTNSFISSLKELDYNTQVGVSHFYHIFYKGCLTNFEIEEGQEASLLYPEVNYTRMDAYLKRYIGL